MLYVTLFNRTYLCCLDLLRAATSTVQMSHRCKQFAFLLCFYFTLISRRHVLPKYGASSSFRPTAHVQARSELKTRETFATRLAMKFSTNPWTKLHHYTRNPPGLLPVFGHDSPRTNFFHNFARYFGSGWKPLNLMLAEA